eukprot:CAMPEP_0197244200 /NCGR_PEP_ID=MMETSP1429-20130617/9402_1 /TAXON_ID=49237 /ORGANISM="Chaetoceros  sp., Strain UNC1202" /LENGTH=309 /DNA_ID=CAMNT_0042704531 /DNA_START=81 /DNA_END=1010 /DNA_ORIENTATION=+
MSSNLSRSYRQPGWFQGAPLTKVVTISTAVFFVILKNGLTDLIALDLQDLVEHLELYRLLTYPLTFSTIGELIMGMAVYVPLLKRFEREMGTRKFAAFSLKSLLLATIINCFFLSDQYLATGPYPIIGTLFYLYNRFTPRLYPKSLSILGFDFSEKAVHHLFAVQLICSQGVYSLIPFVAGYISGFLSSSTITPYGKWSPDIPQFVFRFAHKVGKATGLENLSHAPTYVTSIQRARPGVQRNGDGRGDRNTAPANVQPQYQPMPTADPPSPEAIEQLTAMGFDRDASVRALRNADNNVEHAAHRLLSEN